MLQSEQSIGEGRIGYLNLVGVGGVLMTYLDKTLARLRPPFSTRAAQRFGCTCISCDIASSLSSEPHLLRVCKSSRWWSA